MQDEELDDIVQRLTVAKYALTAQDEALARDAIDAALEMARRLLTARRGASVLRSRPTPEL